MNDHPMPEIDFRSSRKLPELVPPHSLECEQGVLGCQINDPNCVQAINERFASNVCHFYDLRHQEIQKCLFSLWLDGQQIDLITIQEQLKGAGVLQNIGGIEYLIELQDAAPSSANLPVYAEKVQEKFHLRMMIQTCREVMADSYRCTEDVNHFLDQSEAKVMRITEARNRAGMDESRVLNAQQSSSRMIDDLERRFNLQGALSGLDTGFWRLNQMTEGIQFGEQTLIAARPSMGKTAIGLNIFQKVVLEQKIPALFVSLEMSVSALMRRLLSSYHSIPMQAIRRGSYTEGDFAKFSSFKNFVSQCPLHIIDGSGGLSINEISSQIRAHVKKFGTRLVVVDYLQKIQASGRHEKRTYEIGEVSGRLKALAVDTNAAFLTLAQLNRESEKDKGRVPKLSDLADSGQIERDADTVALIHRKRDDETGATKIIIAKQRDGECGMVDLTFNGQFCRFENPGQHPEDVPQPHND